MILRIMGEGQLEIDDSQVGVLNELDGRLEAAVDAGDEAAFRKALHDLLDRVRELGRPLAAESLESSDLILPPTDASIEEVRELLGQEGLIPG